MCVVLEAGWFSLLADDGGICARPMSLLATSGGLGGEKGGDVIRGLARGRRHTHS